jgi:hypothetical protein
MKWLWLASSGIAVAALVALGVLSVDERDVVWEGRRALCPYCRGELPNLALTCPTCRHTLDWVPAKETCRHCLSRENVEHLRNAFAELGTGAGPQPGALAPFGAAYFEVMQPGACTYCAGLGEVVDGVRNVPCPVCRGEGHCIACGGSRSVALGDPAGWSRLLARREVWERAQDSAALTRLPINADELREADVRALHGYVEAEEPLSGLLAKARARIDEAFAALHVELARKPGPAPPGTSGS